MIHGNTNFKKINEENAILGMIGKLSLLRRSSNSFFKRRKKIFGLVDRNGIGIVKFKN